MDRHLCTGRNEFGPGLEKIQRSPDRLRLQKRTGRREAKDSPLLGVILADPPKRSVIGCEPVWTLQYFGPTLLSNQCCSVIVSGNDRIKSRFLCVFNCVPDEGLAIQLSQVLARDPFRPPSGGDQGQDFRRYQRSNSPGILGCIFRQSSNEFSFTNSSTAIRAPGYLRE